MRQERGEEMGRYYERGGEKRRGKMEVKDERSIGRERERENKKREGEREREIGSIEKDGYREKKG